MTVEELGCIESVDPRCIWPNEASDFTPWLAQNIGLLGAAVGLDIEIEEREAPVGAFNVDLLGQELGSDRVVIIENQLGRTDHSHLGQLLAYAAGLDARVVIWISLNVRDEHREAIRWFNEKTSDAAAFFAVELEVWRIGKSAPAPRFNPVVRPSGFQQEIRKPPPSERDLAYSEFFRGLIERLHATAPGFTSAVADAYPRYNNWLSFGSGRTGFGVQVAFDTAQGGRLRVQLAIAPGSGDGGAVRNKAAFDDLYAQREAIERELGMELEWERLDQAVMSRIAVSRSGGIGSMPADIEALQRWVADMLPRFREVFAPRIVNLDIDALIADANDGAA